MNTPLPRVTLPIRDCMALAAVLGRAGYVLHPWRPKHRPMLGRMTKDGAEARIFRTSVVVTGPGPQPLLDLLAAHPELIPAPLPSGAVVIRPRATVHAPGALPPALRGLWAPGASLWWEYDVCAWCNRYAMTQRCDGGARGCEACVLPPVEGEVSR